MCIGRSGFCFEAAHGRGGNDLRKWLGAMLLGVSGGLRWCSESDASAARVFGRVVRMRLQPPTLHHT